jgi:hypothetical protein
MDKVKFMLLATKNYDGDMKACNKVILSFTPYPLFQWDPESNEILLNLSMKCGSNENICGSSGGAQEKGKRG